MEWADCVQRAPAGGISHVIVALLTFQATIRRRDEGRGGVGGWGWGEGVCFGGEGGDFLIPADLWAVICHVFR